MGFWSKLFGGSKPLGRDVFGAEMCERVRACGDDLTVTYDAAQFALRIKGASTADDVVSFSLLTNAYNEYCQVAQGDRQAVLARYAGAAAARLDHLEGDFRNVASRLLPLVRTRRLATATMLRLVEMTGEQIDTPEFAGVALGPTLHLGLAIDYPDRIAHCSASQLLEWGVDLDAALRLSRANLRNLSDEPFREVRPGLYISPWQDSYDASRLACPEMFRSLSLNGDPVCICPTRICVVVTGSDDPLGQRQALELARDAAKSDRPLSMVPLYLRADGTWAEYFPEREHDLTLYRSFRVMDQKQAYDEQKEALEKKFERDDIDMFVATFVVYGKDAEGDDPPAIMQTRATWTAGVNTWLPRSEMVSVLCIDERKIADVSFERLQEAVPHRLKRLDVYPERFETDGFPTANEIAAAGGTFEPMGD